MDSNLKILILLLMGFFFSCHKREWNNPFDSACPKEIWTPTGFKAVQEGTQIKLTWSQPLKNISGFKLSKKVDTGTVADIQNQTKDATQYVDASLTGGKLHSYTIVAYAGSNQSNLLATTITPILTAEGITTMAVSNVTAMSSSSGGTIANDGGSPISARGVCWGTTVNPTSEGSKTTDGTGIGTFSSLLAGLAPNTTYYVRTYATNTAGTSYGNELSFKTLPDISADAGSDTIIGSCQKSLLLDGSKSTGQNITYKWTMLDPGGVLTTNNTSRTFLALSTVIIQTQPVTIRVQLTVTDMHGAMAKDVVAVTFDIPPVAKINFPTPPLNDETLLVDGMVSTGRGLKYFWTTSTGIILGQNNNSSVLIRGLGIYSLKVTDFYGCVSEQTFQYPFESHILSANADYYKSSWVASVVISVLNNDYDSKNDFDKTTLKIVGLPSYGTVIVNTDGSVTYIPANQSPTNDKFIYNICDYSNLCDTAQVTIELN